MPIKVLAALGGRQVPFIESLPANDTGSVSISAEKLGDVAAAEAILLILNPRQGRTLAEAESNPLWGRLPAVAAGRVVISDWNVNLGSVYSARENIRRLEALYATLA